MCKKELMKLNITYTNTTKSTFLFIGILLMKSSCNTFNFVSIHTIKMLFS